MAKIKIIFEAETSALTFNKSGNNTYVNLPYYIEGKVEGINAACRIQGSRFTMISKADKAAKADKADDRIENLEASVGKLTDMLAALLAEKAKAKGKAKA